MKKKIVQLPATFLVVSLICLFSGSTIAQTSKSESESGFLTSMPPNAPTLISPTGDSIENPERVQYLWSPEIHSLSYRINVSLYPDFSGLLVDESSLTDTVFGANAFELGETFYWRVSASNVAGEGEFSEPGSFIIYSTLNVDDNVIRIPDHFSLQPAIPNPFSTTTRITYLLPESSEVSLVLYNLLGQSVTILDSGVRPAGVYVLDWNGDDGSGKPVRNGIYICCLRTGTQVFTQKVILMP